MILISSPNITNLQIRMISLILLVSMVLAFLGLLHAIIIYVRNGRVYRYRSHLLDTIGQICDAEMLAGKPISYEQRIEIFLSIPYDEMVDKWWKPLKSFYPDMGFTEPS